MSFGRYSKWLGPTFASQDSLLFCAAAPPRDHLEQLEIQLIDLLINGPHCCLTVASSCHLRAKATHRTLFKAILKPRCSEGVEKIQMRSQNAPQILISWMLKMYLSFHYSGFPGSHINFVTMATRLQQHRHEKHLPYIITSHSFLR